MNVGVGGNSHSGGWAIIFTFFIHGAPWGGSMHRYAGAWDGFLACRGCKGLVHFDKATCSHLCSSTVGTALNMSTSVEHSLFFRTSPICRAELQRAFFQESGGSFFSVGGSFQPFISVGSGCLRAVLLAVGGQRRGFIPMMLWCGL